MLIGVSKPNTDTNVPGFNDIFLRAHAHTPENPNGMSLPSSNDW